MKYFFFLKVIYIYIYITLRAVQYHLIYTREKKIKSPDNLKSSPISPNIYEKTLNIKEKEGTRLQDMLVQTKFKITNRTVGPYKKRRLRISAQPRQ